MLDDRKPKAAPTRGAGAVGAIEALEQALEILPGDTGTVVLDRQHRAPVLTAQREDARRSVAGVAKRVLGEVLDDDPQHPRAQWQLDRLVLDRKLQRDPGALGALGQLRDDLPQERSGLGRAERDDLATGLELAEEEDIVD